MRKTTKLLVASARRKNGQYARDNARSGDTRNAGRYPMGEYGDWRMPRGGMEYPDMNDMRNEMRGEGGLYSGNDIGFTGAGNMGGSYGRSGGNRSEMNGYQTENRRRRDSRGRYAMADMEDNMARRGGWRSEMNSRSGGGMNNKQGMGRSESYDDDEDDDMELDELTAHEWTKAMENEDGSKGPHWTKEQTKLFMKQVGATDVEPLEFFAIMNAMYSDYCKVAKKYGVDKPEYYAELAKAWLEDKDAVEGKAKMYYKCIVKR